TGWCNLANVAVRCGNTYSADTANGVQLDQWKDLLGEMGQHLQSHNLSFDDDSIKLSPMLELSTETETFTGDYAASANQFLKREYRSGFEVPEIT
ncbi:gfo/Idh/MocA family oxidoreductase, partial [Rhodopirellula sp.]|nr:gfo/Idh/MocA family oxidoreductase [Rhodopirellula sp.]